MIPPFSSVLPARLVDQSFTYSRRSYSCAFGVSRSSHRVSVSLPSQCRRSTSRAAFHLYRGYLDYDGALAELEIARQTLPNDARLFELKGYVERRRQGGNQEEALRNLERAIDLDPRNAFILLQASVSYATLSSLCREEAVLDRALVIEPNNVETKAARRFVELNWKADTRPLHQLIDQFAPKSWRNPKCRR